MWLFPAVVTEVDVEVEVEEQREDMKERFLPTSPATAAWGQEEERKKKEIRCPDNMQFSLIHDTFSPSLILIFPLSSLTSF